MNVRHVLVIGATVATVTAGTWAGEEKCFVREGDVWVFLGDSITHADTYRRTVDRVLRHFHPDARFTLTQKGVSGALATASKEQFDKAAKEDRPTVVSLMTGMNNSINSSWRFGQPMDEPLDSYRQSMVRFVEGAAEKGLAVVLLSPTLTDESLGWGSMWALEGTAEFLRRCGKLVSQIASEHGAVYIPAGEELEAAQARRAPEQLLRADGVHPSAPGQYEIAGSILRRIAPWAELGSGERKLSAAPPPLAVELKPASRFANDGAAEIALTIRCQAATKVTATWSIGDRRASEHIDLAVGEQTWTLRLPAPLKLQPGDSTDLVLDLTDGTRRGVWLIDLCRVPVLHLSGGKVSGTIESGSDRPEGRKCAEWTLSVVDGKWLSFEAETFDSEIRSDADWPWAQDGINLWLDYRPPERLADIGTDSDVYQVMLQPCAVPRFAVRLRPWMGRGFHGPAVVGGHRTPAGYKAHLYVADGNGQMMRFSKHQDADLSKRDFLGINIILVDLDGKDKGGTSLDFHPAFRSQRPHDQYANTFMIVDLRGKLSGDSVVNVCISRLL